MNNIKFYIDVHKNCPEEICLMASVPGTLYDFLIAYYLNGVWTFLDQDPQEQARLTEAGMEFCSMGLPEVKLIKYLSPILLVKDKENE